MQFAFGQKQQQQQHSLWLKLNLGKKTFDASLIAGIGNGVGQTLVHFLALDMAPFDECLHITNDELLSA